MGLAKVDDTLRSSIETAMRLKTTEELEDIWRSNNRVEWSDDAFDVVGALLLERTNQLPEQEPPITTLSEEPDIYARALVWLRIHSRVVLLSACVLLIAIILSSMFYVRSQPLPSIAPVDKVWGRLERTARDWQQDAYLANLSYDVAGKYAGRIVAEYHSANAGTEGLFLQMDGSGPMNVLTMDASSSGAVERVDEQDWAIDAPAALAIFAKDHDVEACLRHPAGAIIQLSLNRVYTTEPAWGLDTFDCPGRDMSLLIDAKTGLPVTP